MSDLQIGPGQGCYYCGGTYGEHTPNCQYQSRAIPVADDFVTRVLADKVADRMMAKAAMFDEMRRAIMLGIESTNIALVLAIERDFRVVEKEMLKRGAELAGILDKANKLAEAKS